MRALLALPFLAACVHTPLPCEWPRTCEERRDAVQAVDAKPQPSKPVDDSNGAHSGDKTSDKNEDRPREHHSRDDNGDSSDDNGGVSK